MSMPLPSAISPPLPPVADALLHASGITVAPRGQPILEGVSLTVTPGETVTLIGPNGAGKTTLVRVMLGLLQPDQGQVWRRPGIRIGYVPQRLNVEPTLPLTVQRFVTLGGHAGRAAVQAALAETGAGHVLGRPLQAISGGELQRVLLARALLRQPQLLVLDEPVQAVDVNGQFELYDLIGRIRRERGCGVLMVSHDLHLVMATTDRVICLNRHVCCAGQPEAVTRHPAYLELFGYEESRHLAIYHHHHNHRHGPHGEVIAAEDVHG